MQVCEKTVKADIFAAAIETEVVVAGPSVDFATIDVPDSYTGPRINDDGVVTADFVVELMEAFKEQKSLHRRYVVQILTLACIEFSAVPSLYDISLPPSVQPANNPSLATTGLSDDATLAAGDDERRHITVCGDTHGQFYDLCNIFAIGGLPSVTNPYVFNGDYVDRGSFSFEVVFTLLCWRLVNSKCIYLMRGNHETKNMNKIYGFEGEVLHKYDKYVMDMFTRVFNNLPLAAVLENTVFVTHGGLSTLKDGAVSLDEIKSITRNREPPESGLMSDLMWSGEYYNMLSCI